MQRLRSLPETKEVDNKSMGKYSHASIKQFNRNSADQFNALNELFEIRFILTVKPQYKIIAMTVLTLHPKSV